MSYLIALIAVWVLGMPTHYSEWDHMPCARLWAFLWPLAIVLGFVLKAAIWILRLLPNWRWRVKWIREVSIKHYGWTTKEGKLCGIIRIVKVFGHTNTDNWIASGLCKGSTMIGTVTRPECVRAYKNWPVCQPSQPDPTTTPPPGQEPK